MVLLKVFLEERRDQKYQMLRSDRLAAKSHLCVRRWTGLRCHARVVVPFRYCSSVGMLIVTACRDRFTHLPTHSGTHSLSYPLIRLPSHLAIRSIGYQLT